MTSPHNVLVEQPLISPTFSLPMLSIVVPCFNEKRYIKACVDSLIEFDYPENNIEIIIVDGLSDDGTRAILFDYAEQYDKLRIIDNPGRSKPVALNLGIKAARGEVVMRIDCHAEYPHNYASVLVKALYTAGADNVGGVRRNVPGGKGLIANSLSAVLTHWFGVGDATHYTGVNQNTLTDIVFLFCVRREIFDEIGYFNEKLIRGQDREFNLRLKENSKKTLLCPEVESRYFARHTIGSFLSWALECGAVPFRINKIVQDNMLSLRNFVPLCFLLGLLATPVVLAVLPQLKIFCFIGLALYTSLNICSSLHVGYKEKNFILPLLMPLTFLSWHLAYAAGSALALLTKPR